MDLVRRWDTRRLPVRRCVGRVARAPAECRVREQAWDPPRGWDQGNAHQAWDPEAWDPDLEAWDPDLEAWDLAGRRHQGSRHLPGILVAPEHDLADLDPLCRVARRPDRSRVAPRLARIRRAAPRRVELPVSTDRHQVARACLPASLLPVADQQVRRQAPWDHLRE
jgi:hypothetical protein